jgi:hypothetical protein
MVVVFRDEEEGSQWIAIINGHCLIVASKAAKLADFGLSLTFRVDLITLPQAIFFAAEECPPRCTSTSAVPRGSR